MNTTDFLATVMDMRGGSVAAQCSQRFSDLIAAVIEQGKGGDFVLKLSVKPSKLSMTAGVIEVSVDADIKVRKPEEEPGAAMFFVTKDGRLSKDDPKQVEMGLFYEKERKQ